jgi:hypothetical protein
MGTNTQIICRSYKRICVTTKNVCSPASNAKPTKEAELPAPVHQGSSEDEEDGRYQGNISVWSLVRSAKHFL